MMFFSNKNKTSSATRYLTQAGVIAALYAVTTILLAPFSFGAVQCRISEALTLLPVFTPAAVPGLFIGCLIANMLGSAVWYDMVLGSLTTLMAAFLTRKLRKHLFPASLPPVILNGVIVGAVVYFAYEHGAGEPILPVQLLLTMLSVAAGEAVSCCLLGVGMVHVLKKLPERLWKLD